MSAASCDQLCLIAKIFQPTAKPAAKISPPPGRTTAPDEAASCQRCYAGR
jgi:hypothetical protein